VLFFRVARPLVQAVRFDLRVVEVTHEAPGVVSLRIGGRGLERLGAEAGQFFFWRFLTRGFWSTKHPFSLSEAPNGDSYRITVKALGDHTARMGTLKPGTRIVAEGPFGVFTARARRRDRVLLVAGGIGITPVRALLEELDGDVTVVYRVVNEEELLFLDELEGIAARTGARVLTVVGDHRTEEGRRLLTVEHLRELVPDAAERDVFLCGPPAMTDALESTLRAAGVPRSHVHVERFAL
jgi:ferredoxin-NADP reductase